MFCTRTKFHKCMNSIRNAAYFYNSKCGQARVSRFPYNLGRCGFHSMCPGPERGPPCVCLCFSDLVVADCFFLVLVSSPGLAVVLLKSCLFRGCFSLTDLGTGSARQYKPGNGPRLTNLGTNVFTVTLCFRPALRPKFSPNTRTALLGMQTPWWG